MRDKGNGTIVESLLCEDVARAGLLTSVVDIMKVLCECRL